MLDTIKRSVAQAPFAKADDSGKVLILIGCAAALIALKHYAEGRGKAAAAGLKGLSEDDKKEGSP